MTDYPAHEYLRDVAGHFARSDWQWTRRTQIRHIRYASDWSGYNAPWRRVCRAVRHIFRPPTLLRAVSRPTALWAMLRVDLGTETHQPDGEIAHAGIICHWEEDGEYLQVVQPSVGLLLADFLATDPTHPSARAIAAEIDRIRADYDRRAGESGDQA